MKGPDEGIRTDNKEIVMPLLSGGRGMYAHIPRPMNEVSKGGRYGTEEAESAICMFSSVSFLTVKRLLCQGGRNGSRYIVFGAGRGWIPNIQANQKTLFIGEGA